MKIKRSYYIIIICIAFCFSGIWAFKKFNFNTAYTIGQPLDSLNGVKVYYNGGVDNVSERTLTKDNYNLGLKYQCVEFVKRYYYERFHHKMPDSYGHAKDFYDDELSDGAKNQKRDLIQYHNPSKSKPKVEDLIVLSGTIFNRFGHVAIISKVTDNEIEIIQQNPGPFGKSRETYLLKKEIGNWKIDNDRILGWLRK
ncbi:CHAP domain-containing protein [Flavobacterium aestivum]|uniref:CHAP domain-containing protein n=1 Tax=Flavobacterium aestivum TaxID=3003257 RepID=UPI002285765B|nr:CHAP domain-containing protein [Flavobacterium aestivum]